MTTRLDDKLVPKAKTLCETYGKSMVFTYFTSGPTYDPTTGQVSSSTTTATVKCTPPEKYKEKYEEGEVSEMEMMVTYLPAEDLAFTPDKNIKVAFDGEDWTIIQIERHYTGESIALYELTLSR